MRQTFKHYRNGYLLVRLQGFSPERFLNLCMANQIEVWELRNIEGFYQFYMTLDGYRKIRPLVRKAHVRLKILGRFGLPFFLYRNRRRKFYGAGIAAFFVILFVMSQFIWNITLEGNYRFTDDTLLHYLDSQDIRYGILKSKIDCDSLEEAIRSQYPEIIWVSARVSGTRLMIKVKENEVMASIPIKDEEPRDLVADKDGVITSMIVRKGKAQVAVGDTVEKGQVLVSGTIPIYNDAEELVNCQYVRADADIRVKTKVTYSEQIPHLTTERVDTGRSRHGIRFRLFSRSLTLLLPASGDLPWEFVQESRQAVVLGDFFLPVWIDHIVGKEYGLYERFLTNGEVTAIKNEINHRKIQNLEEKGVQIIENNVKILDKSSAWVIQGDFLVEDSIGTGQNIIKTEETDQPDERNRDDN